MINRILSTEKKRNRGHMIQDTDPPQPGGPSEEGPADLNFPPNYESIKTLSHLAHAKK